MLFDDEGNASGVVVKGPDGQQKEIACRVVIDGTGSSRSSQTSWALKQVDPDLKKAAIWTYYKDAKRGEGDNAGATIILNTEDKQAWFWFIPLSRGITSIGCVSDHEYLLKAGDQLRKFSEQKSCPNVGLDASLGGSHATW